MFGLFKKKSELELLNIEYKKCLETALNFLLQTEVKVTRNIKKQMILLKK